MIAAPPVVAAIMSSPPRIPSFRSSSSSASSALSSSSFQIMITGQIESASFPSTMNNLYCRYVISYGKDWNVTHGVTSGLSQIAQWKHVPNIQPQFRSSSSSSLSSFYNRNNNTTYYSPTIVWNFPIEISFQSTNIYGWPRISIAIYGLDFLGRDVVRGYGSVLLPIISTGGRYEDIIIETYRPISGSLCHRFMNWINGTLPEYYETAFTAQGEGRALTRVLGEGRVKVVLNVVMKDMKKFGFAVD